MKAIRILRVLLCVGLFAALMVPVCAFADEPNDTIADSYYRQSLAALNDEGVVASSSESVTLASDGDAQALVVSGSKSALNASTLTIQKQFVFDGNAVGRFTYSGLAAKGKKVILSFYLDNETEPFATSQMKSQKKDSWADLAEVSTPIVSKNLTGTHTLTIKVETTSSSPSFALGYVEFSQSSVPIVNFDIDESLGTIKDMNESEKHTATCYGSLSIEVPQGCTSAMTGQALTGTDSIDLDYIRGRGNSTWTMPKKPYKFKLDDAADLLGMGSNKHWALMANAMDASLLRNVMTSRLGMATDMAYTPSLEPVEVVMNGEYLGCYVLAEVTRVDDTRVDIARLDDEPDATDEATISGGYLLSLGNWTLDADKLNFTTSKAKGVFQVEYPSLYGNDNTTQFDYIKNYVQSVEDALYEGGDVASLMDYGSAAKYFWIEELSQNGDGYTSGSCYLYKDRNGKLCWGPLWDFDIAWGSQQNNWYHTNSFWNDQLFQRPDFVNVVKQAWPVYKTALNEITREGGTLDYLIDHVRIAASYDSEREATEATDPNHSGLDTYAAVFDEAVEELRSQVKSRTAWVDSQLDQLDVNVVDIDFKVDGQVYTTIQRVCNHGIGTLPEAPEKEGYCFEYWECTSIITLESEQQRTGFTEEEYLIYLQDVMGYDEEGAAARIEELRNGVEERTALTEYVEVAPGFDVNAYYVKKSDLTAVKQIVLSQDTFYGVDTGEDYNVLSLRYQVIPFFGDTEDEHLSVTSSDESVVTSSDNMSPEIVGPGDCTLTIKHVNGATATVKAHVYTVEEYEALGEFDLSQYGLGASSITVTEGGYATIPLTGMPEGSAESVGLLFETSDDTIVRIGDAGVIYGVKAGTAIVKSTNMDGTVATCAVTVTKGKSGTEVGDVVTSGNLKYKVLSMTAGDRRVACVGPVQKTLTTAKVANTITVDGQTYQVTAIARGAFKGCSKLKKVYTGKNLQIVGPDAFRGCKSLTKVVFKSKQKPKVYKTAFKGVKKKCKYYVPKSQKKYYKIILKGKKVRKL